MQDEFYAIAFRKKMYSSLDNLQTDIDQWLTFYNTERPHSGRYCFGKTPVQTFADSKALAAAKDINTYSNKLLTLNCLVNRTQALQRCNLPDITRRMEIVKRLKKHQPLYLLIIFISIPKKPFTVRLSNNDYKLVQD